MRNDIAARTDDAVDTDFRDAAREIAERVLADAVRANDGSLTWGRGTGLGQAGSTSC